LLGNVKENSETEKCEWLIKEIIKNEANKEEEIKESKEITETENKVKEESEDENICSKEEEIKESKN